MSPTNTIIVLIFMFITAADSLLILDKLAQIKDKLVAKEQCHVQQTIKIGSLSIKYFVVLIIMNQDKLNSECLNT